MSGDGKDDITIPVLFLFHKEGHELLDAMEKSKDLLVYLGHKAKQPGSFLLETNDSETLKSQPYRLLVERNHGVVLTLGSNNHKV